MNQKLQCHAYFYNYFIVKLISSVI